jgi:uncharacterized Tic20 family protein
MTRSTIPLTIRIDAILCHLLNLTWLAIMLVGAATQVMGPDRAGDDHYTEKGWLLLALSLLGATILTLIFWLFVSGRHPFVKESGKEAINFSLSFDLYALTICAISYIYEPARVNAYEAGSLLGVTLILWLTHFCSILWGCIGAGLGKIYRYPLTIRFFR